MAMHLNESNPKFPCAEDFEESVFLENLDGKYDHVEFERFLSSWEDRNKVNRIKLTSTSKITCLWFPKYFPYLNDLFVNSQALSSLCGIENWLRPKRFLYDVPKGPIIDFSPLSDKEISEVFIRFKDKKETETILKARGVVTLGLLEWKWSDIAEICGMKFENLAIVRGSVESLNGLENRKLDCLELLECKKLKFLPSLEVKQLRIDGCNNLDLNSLVNCENLQILKLNNQTGVRDWSFLGKFPCVEQLSIISKIKVFDIGWIKTSKRLKFLRLSVYGRDGEELIRSISLQFPQLVVANMTSCFQNGVSCSEPANC